jgi:hypothetical protein
MPVPALLTADHMVPATKRLDFLLSTFHNPIRSLLTSQVQAGRQSRRRCQLSVLKVGFAVERADFRRDFLENAEVYGLNDTYSYSFEEPAPNATVGGVAHGTDIAFTFGSVSNATGYSAGAVQVQTALIAYW